MCKLSKKLKKALAVCMAFAMVATTASVAPSTDASAAKKVVKSLKVSKANVTLTAGKKAKIKATVKGTASEKVKVSLSKANKKVISKVKVGKPSKKGISTITITAKKVTSETKTTVKVTTVGKNKNKKALTKKVTITVKPVAAGDTTTPGGETKPGTTTQPGTQPGTQTAVAVESITLTTATGKTTMTVGEVSQIVSTITPAAAASTAVTYVSSNPQVVEVSATGLMTARATGAATIVATAGGKTAMLNVTVESVKVTGVVLDAEELTNMTINGTSTLKATVLPAEATNRKVTWSSADPTIATVDANGKVTAVGEGTTTITVTTEDGEFTATCTVTVQASTEGISDGITVTVTNPMEQYSDAAKSDYVVMTGNDANVRVRIAKDGKPVGNQSVKLEITPQYGNCEALYKIEGEKSSKFGTTDEDGYVSFPISLTENYATEKAGKTDKYQSYTLTASVTGDTFSKGTAVLSFGCVLLEELHVVNYYDSTLPEIALGKNAATAGDYGYAYTATKNGSHFVEYVTSQQVSTEKVPHAITMALDPILVLPAKASEVKTGVYEEEINRVSGDYSIYNDDTNEQTTTVIETIPAGLEWARLNFDSIQLSEYTKLSIKFYEKNTSIMIGEEITKVAGDLNDDALTVQVPIRDDVDVTAVIALISEGQVNDDANEGYTLANVVGEWKSQNTSMRDIEVIDGAVTWGKDNSFTRSTIKDTEELGYEFAQAYLPADSEYLKEGFTYSYSVPAFPSVGNAIIYVKDANEKVVAYYSYPSCNQTDEDGKYLNMNDICEASTTRKAVLISEQETSKQVGDITQSGNYVTADTTVTGYTPLKATVDLSAWGIEDMGENSFYTFVQWAPMPKVEDAIVAEDFYALYGQTVTVTAQLQDEGGSPVSAQNEPITFEAANAKDEEWDKFTDVEVLKTLKTDSYGRCELQLRSSNDARFLQQLQATSEDYNVTIEIGGKTVDVANIHWVGAGLYFKDSVDLSSSTGNEFAVFDSQATTSENMTRAVGNNWIIGMKVIGELATDDIYWNEYEVSDIDGIDIGFEKSGVGTGAEDSNKNGAYNIISTEIGATTLTGAINSTSVLDNVVFTIRDSLGNVVGRYNNVGTGTSSINARITLNMDWKEAGLQMNLVYPFGKQLDITTATTVYVKIQDDFGNKLSGRDVTYVVSSKDIAGMDGIEQTGKTNEYGLLPIDLDAPGTAGTVTIKATDVLTGEIVTEDIIYSDSTYTDPFGVESATLSKSGDTYYVTVKFSTIVREDLLDTKAFLIADGTKEYKISNVQRSANDGAVVTLTLDTNAIADAVLADVALTVREYETDGVKYEILDTVNRPITGTSTVTITE